MKNPYFHIKLPIQKNILEPNNLEPTTYFIWKMSIFEHKCCFIYNEQSILYENMKISYKITTSFLTKHLYHMKNVFFHTKLPTHTILYEKYTFPYKITHSWNFFFFWKIFISLFDTLFYMWKLNFHIKLPIHQKNPFFSISLMHTQFYMENDNFHTKSPLHFTPNTFFA